ncbi:MAG TPA: DUF1232 domain-containing protein [Actinomycetota bacterium]|nr:DUF1232 domain-containing protein [Actinomycetota bacterium]
MAIEHPDAGPDEEAKARSATALKEYVLLVPRLIRLVWRLMRDPRVPARSKAALVVLAGYIVFPVDVIPDFIPGVGQLDELVLTAFALDQILNRVPYEVVAEHWEGEEDLLQVIREVLDLSTAFIPGWLKARFSKS